jgi:phosphonate degradation associated HDIG domain protein
VADEVCALLQGAADREYIGEAISQLAHGLQAGALAERAGADDELILAALLHDVGHLAFPAGTPDMAGFGVKEHERHGAEYLRARGFSDRVATLVRRHVDAKRYLVARSPAYAARLSDASTQTLRWQGGPMTAAEVAGFEAFPMHADILRLRAWDEAAKDPQARVPGLDVYRARIVAHLKR